MKVLNKVFALAVTLLCSAGLWGATPKYVFFMIGDGMGINHVYLTEYYMHRSGMGDLNFKHFPVATMISTYSASSLVTDSAAAGTALATGHKTNNRMLGMLPDSTIVASLSERAKSAGYGAGVVTSDGMTQATPSAFSIHVAERSNSDEIAAQMIGSRVDFMAGATMRSNSYTAEQWIGEAEAAGMEVFCGDRVYSPVRGRRVLYLSDDTDCREFPYVIDMDNSSRRLKDFTSAAIEYLYGNFSNGFFLMVEGANIDHASHSRDAASMVREIIDFSESVDLALQFYDRHPEETLIIVVADHETGGFSLTGGKPELLSSQKCSVSALTASLNSMGESGTPVSWQDVKSLLSGKLGLWDTVEVTAEEEEVLLSLYRESFVEHKSDTEGDLYHSNKKLALEAVRYLGGKAGAVFGGRSHTSAPVGLFVKGSGAEEFLGCRDNTDVNAAVCRAAGYNQSDF